jgi:putative heme iron utilization protein
VKDEDASLLMTLMTTRRTLSLAVVDDGLPVIGMLPFVVEADLSAVLVHVSSLAPHGRALADGSRFAILIQGPDADGRNPGEIPRARFSGSAQRVARGSEGFSAARDRYLERFPDSDVTFSLGDFEMYRLPLERGRLIAGFARTVNLTPESLRRVAEQPGN